MPFEDIVETHPWIRFPGTPNQSKNLIIGSFPPNKFTTHRERLTLCDLDFFYGSKENAFWKLFIDALGLTFKLPDDLPNLKYWLKVNKWTATDIVLAAKRKKDTAYDTDLIEIKWNIGTIKTILQENPIENIYFTSQWVKEKFDSFIEPHLNYRQLKTIQKIILLSPSRNGLRKAKLAKFTKFKCNAGETAEQYRKRYYSIVLASNTTTNSGFASAGSTE